MENHRIQAWVASTALRLKLQASAAANLTAEERGHHLETVVERMAQELPPAQRPEAIHQLMQALPGVEIRMMLGSVADPAPFGSIPATLRTAADAAGDLALMWRKAPPEERTQCLALMARAGIIDGDPTVAGSQGRLADLSPDDYDRAALKVDILRSMLGMSDADCASPLDLQKVFTVLKCLVDLTLDSDDITSTMAVLWSDLCRNAGIENRVNLGASVKVTATALRDALENGDMGALDAAVRGQREQKTAVRLLLALAAGLGQGGRLFARELTRKLSAEAIAEEVRKSGSITPERCWRQYEYLTNQLTPGEIEYQLLRGIVTSAQQLFAAGPRESSR